VRASLSRMEGTGAQGADGPLPIAGGFKVKCQFERNDGFASSEESFEFFCDADVSPGASRCGLPLVKNFTIERVREGVEIGARSVGEIVVSSTTDQAGAAFEVIAELFDGFGIFSERRGCSPNRKRDFHEAGGFEEPLFLRAEAIDFQLDETRELMRDRDFEIGEGSGLMPSGAAAFTDAHEGSLRDKVIENRGGKERVAAGALMNEVIELRGWVLLLESATEEMLDGLFGQGFERELCAELLYQQILLNGFEIELCRVMLRAIGCDNEQPGRGASTRKGGDEFERRLMRPLDIFDDKDQELPRREIFESLAEFAGAVLKTS
jgi:hypothetical protein